MARTTKRTVSKRNQSWFTSNGTTLAADLDNSAAPTPTTERTCQPTLEQAHLQRHLQASTEASTYAIYSTSDIEKGMPLLNLITKEAWIEFRPRYTI